MNNIVFEKTLKVINSCKTLEQCLVARKYINLTTKYFLYIDNTPDMCINRMFAKRLNNKRDKIYNNE